MWLFKCNILWYKCINIIWNVVMNIFNINVCIDVVPMSVRPGDWSSLWCKVWVMWIIYVIMWNRWKCDA